MSHPGSTNEINLTPVILMFYAEGVNHRLKYGIDIEKFHHGKVYRYCSIIQLQNSGILKGCVSKLGEYWP